MMKFQVLISCMHQKDASIIQRSNVQSDVVVVNQCDRDFIDEFDFVNYKGRKCHAKFIYTTERGLSRSRNMAINNAWSDICYLCDDDELLSENIEETILKAYSENPNIDIITFALVRKGYSYSYKKKIMGLKQIMKTSSVQTSFRKSAIVNNNILFDIKMGSGSGNGGGEENKFLMDCKRMGLKMLYLPDIIATVKSEDSQWFHGFDEKHFRDTFWAARRSLGSMPAFIYIFYWCLFASRKYDIKFSKFKMIKLSLQGFLEKR